VDGKFLLVDGERFHVRGVTYGPFRPDREGVDYPASDIVERDFSMMADAGVNTVRTYTVPPHWLLDAALRHGLRVMVGLAWEQHVAFLDGELRRAGAIEDRVRAGVRMCAGHPAILCYAVGNEIPAGIVRWHGQAAIERFIERLCRVAREEDAAALVTYVSYPTTEYLRVPFVDLVCFNVYLESAERLRAYLPRLQHLAGDRPLVVAEMGLDSRRGGEARQAMILEQEIAVAWATGCAGTFVFAWTDEWHRGGQDIDDWSFGLTAADRQPKPALAAVRRAYAAVPFPADTPWPRVSVVVCVHNGARTLAECLDGIARLRYPDYEVIVVDDGSTDATAAIAQARPVRLVVTGANVGLSRARNLGLAAASGEIVAYIDDDAWPDPYWLHYLAWTFLTSDHAGVGGPNLPPPGDGLVADCVANTPGGPIHILIDDEEAEHIPGCNMAFRRSALTAVGGFDARFRIAGDDVDLGWRLQQRGWTLGFHPAAVVWHHRRGLVRAFWRQQLNYGRAEALLERKWPEKYNALGHLAWRGRLYDNGGSPQPVGRWRVYYGVWGSGLFQSIYERGSGIMSVTRMPEWYLAAAAMLLVSALGVLWQPLRLALPVSLVAFVAPIALAAASAARASYRELPGERSVLFRRRAVTAMLHLLQPVARLVGRVSYDLTPWRRRGLEGFRWPLPVTAVLWSERWLDASDWLHRLDGRLRARGANVCVGGVFDRWDLEVRDGPLGAARTLLAVEEHGEGRQLLRFRIRPFVSSVMTWASVLLICLSVGAMMDGALTVGVALGLAALVGAAAAGYQAGTATAAAYAAIEALHVEANVDGAGDTAAATFGRPTATADSAADPSGPVAASPQSNGTRRERAREGGSRVGS
jgi:GT2 family glycosyltransferase